MRIFRLLDLIGIEENLNVLFSHQFSPEGRAGGFNLRRY